MQTQSAGRSVEQNVAAIQALDLNPIKFRLSHPEAGKGWSREDADRIEIEYKRFLTLLVKYPDEKIPPTNEVDEFWHQHILDTTKYAEDCETVFGYFLHHFPYFGMRGEQDAKNQADAGEMFSRLYTQEFGDALAAKGAYCFASVRPLQAKDTAYCFASARPLQADGAAYCFASARSLQGKDAAYCFANARPIQAKDAAYCFAEVEPDDAHSEDSQRTASPSAACVLAQ